MNDARQRFSTAMKETPQRNLPRPVHRGLPPCGVGKLLERVAALGLVSLILIAGIAAVNPQFHKHLHNGAGSPQHLCLVTLLEHFQFTAVLGEVSLALVVFGAPLGVLAAFGVWFPRFDCESPPGRAPPAPLRFLPR